jgi:hypothetical protein
MNRAVPLACLLLILSPAVPAQQDGGNQPPHGDHGPPPEAYAACEGKTAGASVTITLRDGRAIDGVCEEIGDRLAARPLRRPGDGDLMPPPGNSGGS